MGFTENTEPPPTHTHNSCGVGKRPPQCVFDPNTAIQMFLCPAYLVEARITARESRGCDSRTWNSQGLYQVSERVPRPREPGNAPYRQERPSWRYASRLAMPPAFVPLSYKQHGTRPHAVDAQLYAPLPTLENQAYNIKKYRSLSCSDYWVNH